jgi:hypothetical protein
MISTSCRMIRLIAACTIGKTTAVRPGTRAVTRPNSRVRLAVIGTATNCDVECAAPLTYTSLTMLGATNSSVCSTSASRLPATR